MSRITIQRGHCFRTSGATGGRGEQKFADSVGKLMTDELRSLGHDVRLLTADESVPHYRDVFVALHTDGSTNKNARGASVGYPYDSDGKLAQAWKRAHQRAGFPSGFYPDNYTENLRKYYGFGRAVGYRHEFLAEHGFHSNDNEYLWLHSHYRECALAHVAAIGEIVGHPNGGPVNYDPTPTDKAVDVVEFLDGRVWTFASDGGVFAEQGAGFFGSMGGQTLSFPVVSGLVTNDGGGYILVGADGGLFHFGNSPRIQPYIPLMQEVARGERIIRRGRWADMENKVITLLSNLGERYHLFT